MTADEAATRIADNAILKAVGRVALVLVIPVAGYWFAQNGDAMSKQASAIATLSEEVTLLRTRVVVVENKQDAGKDRGDALRAAVADLQDAVDAMKTDQSKQNTAILTQLAAITAKLEERDRP